MIRLAHTSESGISRAAAANGLCRRNKKTGENPPAGFRISILRETDETGASSRKRRSVFMENPAYFSHGKTYCVRPSSSRTAVISFWTLSLIGTPSLRARRISYSFSPAV